MYRNQVRRAYINEIITVLHQIRASILRYIIDRESFPTRWGDLDIEDPSNAKWSYVFRGNTNSFTITATKLTPPYQNLHVQIDKAGNINVF